MKASSDRCSALLQDIFQPLEESMKQGVFSKPRGYRLLIQKIQDLKEQYYQEPGKGTQVAMTYSFILKSCLHASLKRLSDQV